MSWTGLIASLKSLIFSMVGKMRKPGKARWDGIRQAWVVDAPIPQAPAPEVPPGFGHPFDWARKLNALKLAQKAREEAQERERVIQAQEDPQPVEPNWDEEPQDFEEDPEPDVEEQLREAARRRQERAMREREADLRLAGNIQFGLNDMVMVRDDDAPWGKPPKRLAMNIKEGPAGFRTMTERSTRLPRFKLEYATQEEGRMRLEGTLVTVQDRMVKVVKVTQVRQDGEAGMGCVAIDENGDQSYLLFSKEGMNFRSPDPGYIQIGSAAFHFRRRPARVYKQGISGENTYFSKVGRDGQTPLFGRVPDHTIIRAFNERPVIQFHEGLMEDKESVRLSDRVAVFKRNGGKFHVEHRGVVLGVLKEGKVRVENCSVWVENALNAVGIEAISVEG